MPKRKKQQPIQDCFGNTASDKMPLRLFGNAVFIDHATAVQADITKQNCCLCPRYWYVDTKYECRRCKQLFIWTAAEQRIWFEDYFIWIDAHPSHCKACRKSLRQLEEIRKEYDRQVAQARQGTAEGKRRVIKLIDELTLGMGALPAKMIETRRVLEKQLERMEL